MWLSDEGQGTSSLSLLIFPVTKRAAPAWLARSRLQMLSSAQVQRALYIFLLKFQVFIREREGRREGDRERGREGSRERGKEGGKERCFSSIMWGTSTHLYSLRHLTSQQFVFFNTKSKASGLPWTNSWGGDLVCQEEGVGMRVRKSCRHPEPFSFCL